LEIVAEGWEGGWGLLFSTSKYLAVSTTTQRDVRQPWRGMAAMIRTTLRMR